MTIANVTRLPAASNEEYAAGAKYNVIFEVAFAGNYDSQAIKDNSDERLPKIGWTLGKEQGAIETDDTVYARSIAVSLKPGSQYTADATTRGIAIYTVAYIQISPQFAVDPLDRVDVDWGGSDLTQVPTRDKDGKLIRNSAKQPYSGVPAYPIRAASCTITKRQRENPADIVTLYSNTTNSAEIWGVAVGNGLIGKIVARKVQEGSQAFWELKFPLQFRRDGWRLWLYDNGYIFTDDDGNPQTATDLHGNPKPTPVLLDGSGKQLGASASPVLFPTSGTPVYEEIDWNLLDLPNPFTF